MDQRSPWKGGDAIDIVIHTVEKACVLVALTFVLACTGSFARLLARDPSRRDRVAALLVFLGMTLAEELVAQYHAPTPMNARIIAACAAGLLAGPAVGGIVGVASTLLAWAFQGFLPAGLGLPMIAGGLGGGLVWQLRPAWALRPTTGLLVGVLATLLRYPAAAAFHALFHMNGPALSFGMEALTAGVNGGGVALILLVFAQVRAREAAARAAAMAELRALQARMNPHFLFNALNAIAALSALNPKAVPAATARLGRFLRGSLEQHDRLTVPFREELAIVEAYLEIESLRFGKRLRVKTDLAADTQDVHVPPFLVQVLVENAVRHGIQPREEGGLVHVTARVEGPLLVVSVYDTGVGIAAEQLRQLRREAADGSHALTLLKRRLRGLYDDGFTLDIRSHPGKDTTVTVCVPLKSQLVIREVGAKHDSSRGRRGRAARPGVPVRAAGGHAEG